jgi:hypothetical protein
MASPLEVIERELYAAKTNTGRIMGASPTATETCGRSARLR